jgi:RNA polymerase sigma factor (sigma-70 family)
LFDRVRVMAAVQTLRPLSDRALVESFIQRHDEAAFTALVERHGPMVRAVCVRVLHNSHDADDACQSTFLVFARKASTLLKRESLASWLHGTASRVAANLKRENARRRRREKGVLPPLPVSRDSLQDILEVLDEELHKLPQRYRDPLILCYLEAYSQPEAFIVGSVAELDLKNLKEGTSVGLEFHFSAKAGKIILSSIQTATSKQPPK